jgi:GNAT superfamily N-acetyltransferase
MMSLPTRTLTIRGGTETVQARPATEADWPKIVQMHCSIPDMPWARPPEEMTPEERSAYGGPWMSIETLRELYGQYAARHSPILVAEDASGRVVGNVDLWVSREAEPVGPNAFVEIVQEHAEYVGSGLENELLRYAAEVARALRCPALDGSFGWGGLSDDYYQKRRMGFHIWDEHDEVEAACAPGPMVGVSDIASCADTVHDAVILARWAPTEFAWLNWLEKEPHYLKIESGRAICFASGTDAVHRRGSDPHGEVLSTTFYVPGDRRHDAALVSDLLRVYGAYAADYGYRVFRVGVPSAVTPELRGVEVHWTKYVATCLRMGL